MAALVFLVAERKIKLDKKKNHKPTSELFKYEHSDSEEKCFFFLFYLQPLLLYF